MVRGFCAAACFAALTAACGPTCNKEGVPGEEVEYRGGETNVAGNAYQTGGWCEPWLHLPNGRTYRLMHGLGTRPELTEVLVSFKELPFGEDCEEPGLAAPSAGNISVIENVTDEYIQVRNDTCEPSFYLRLVAISPGAWLSDTDGDAGTSQAVDEIPPGTVSLP
jgi:hypothetical protein